MTRRAFLSLPAFAISKSRTPATLIMEDRLDATQQEADEGYFALGQQLGLSVRPDSAAATALRRWRERDVRVTVELR